MADPHPDLEVRRLLVYLGTAMIASGQPVGEVEDEVREVGVALGYPDVQIAAAPTGINLNLASGQPATFESVNRPLRLDQAAEVRTIRYRLLSGDLTAGQTIERLLDVRAMRPPYPAWLASLGWIGISTGIAFILQPGWPNIAFAAVGGILVVGLHRLSQRFALIATLLPTLAAFVLACLVFLAADAGLLEGPLRTLLPPLAVLLPGALLVTGMSELAAGDMMAGSARVIFGLVQLALFTLGIVAAARVVGMPAEELTNVRVDEVGWWATPIGLLLIMVGIGVLESPPIRLLPWISIVLVLTLAAQTVGQLVGPALGSFLGALGASLGAYLVEAVKPQLPRLVVFLPSFWLLVPGSLGLLSTTQLAVDPDRAGATATGVFIVVCALALGLLVGSAVAQSVRGLRRRLHRV